MQTSGILSMSCSKLGEDVMCVATWWRHLQCIHTTLRESLQSMGTYQQPRRTSIYGLSMFVRMLHANFCMWEAQQISENPAVFFSSLNIYLYIVYKVRVISKASQDSDLGTLRMSGGIMRGVHFYKLPLSRRERSVYIVEE